MKRVVTAAATAALACGLFAGSALGANEANPNNVAAKQCQAEKQGMGNKAFKESYGGKHAMQQCKRKNRGEAVEAVENASQECAAEREADEDAFNAQYGTGPNGSNAFGKCVSGKASDEAEENAEENVNAAKECKAERQENDEEAFNAEYGKNENDRNAFGKCVSEKAQEDEKPEPEPTA